MDIGWNIGVEFGKITWEVYATEIKNTYTKRSPLGHYFLLPNEIFTLGLSPGELSGLRLSDFLRGQENAPVLAQYRTH